MTLEPTDQFDVIVAEGLRGRAAHATVHGRGMSDVRRRIRRRRQRQMAVGLVPAVAGLGWAVTRPVADAPLTPSGEAGPCGETTSFPPTTAPWTSDVTSTTIAFDENGNVVDANGSASTVPPTTGEAGDLLAGTTTTMPMPLSPVGYVVSEGDSLITISEVFGITPEELAWANGWVDGTAHLIYPDDILRLPAWAEVDRSESVVTVRVGDVTDDTAVSTTTSAPVAWTGLSTSLPLVDSDGNPILVATTWVGDATATTICEPTTLPTTVPVTTDVPVTTGFGDSTTTSTIVIGDLTSTKVQVANCSATNGVAGMMSSVLAEVGFTTVEATNGTCDPKLDSSYVVYDEGVPGADDVAHALADMLGGLMAEPGVLPLKVESAAWAEGSGVVLYLGNDLAGKTLDQIQGLPPDA